MPRIPTFPKLFDEAKTIEASNLKKWGYLKKGGFKSGVITWKRHGEIVSSINIVVSYIEYPILRLSYQYGDEPIHYEIKLESIPSNLGVGQIWYFVCPVTGKRCRKLYCIGKYFLHREAFPNAYYEKQTYSSNYRSMDIAFRYYHMMDKIYSEIYSKYFKKTYNGKPTKRYTKLLEQLDESREKEHLALEYLNQFK